MTFKPYQLAALWLVCCVSYCTVVALVYVGVPETWLYDQVTKYSGLMQGYEWDQRYALFVFLTSAFINAAILWGVMASICKHKKS